jgi:hypothetical protein
MEQKSYKNSGKFLLAFSTIGSLIIVFLSFKDGNFIANLNNGSFFRTLLFSITCILLILGGVGMKNKYPEYYKYQIVSGVILLSVSLIIDIIPRIIYLN